MDRVSSFAVTVMGQEKRESVHSKATTAVEMNDPEWKGKGKQLDGAKPETITPLDLSWWSGAKKKKYGIQVMARCC